MRGRMQRKGRGVCDTVWNGLLCLLSAVSSLSLCRLMCAFYLSHYTVNKMLIDQRLCRYPQETRRNTLMTTRFGSSASSSLSRCFTNWDVNIYTDAFITSDILKEMSCSKHIKQKDTMGLTASYGNHFFYNYDNTIFKLLRQHHGCSFKTREI